MLVYCTIELSDQTKNLIEQETESIFNDHQEYLWYEKSSYRAVLYTWHDVEPDLLDKLSAKVSELVGWEKPFTLFGFGYAVKIGTRIDVQLDLQDDKKYRDMVTKLQQYFDPDAPPNSLSHIALARYKIPSKQQYSHLKNQLEKLKTDVDISVESLSLMKVTQFGNGINTCEELAKIPLRKET